MRNILDMFDLIKAEIQTRQVPALVEPLDVRNEIIVEINLGQVPGYEGRELDSGYLVLAES